MRSLPTPIPGVVLIKPERHRDNRGFFMETFRAEWFPEIVFVQDNHSRSEEPMTLRGLHYQAPPGDQAKLVRVIRGRIRDVAVDLRAGSPTFLQHVSIELDAESTDQLYVPAGFAHGFLILEPDTEVVYKVSNYFDPQAERGIRWDDPALDIDWGLDTEPILSERDRSHPPFVPSATPFQFAGI